MNRMFVVLILLVFILMGIWFYFFFQRLFTLFHPEKRRFSTRLLSVFGAAICIMASLRVYGIGAVIVLHFLIFGVVTDILQAVFCRVIKSPGIRKRWNFLRRSGLIPLALTVLWMGYGYWNMHQIFRTEYTVETEKELNGDLKIVQISDLHMGTTMDVEKLGSVLQEIQEEKPDILALTGDIFDERTPREMMEKTAKLLGGVRTTYGAYYVFGNHDYNSYTQEPYYTAEDLKATLQRDGIHVLDDRAETIPCGVTVIGRNDVSRPREELAELMEDADAQRFLLLLDHQPREGDVYAGAGIDLQLSGHTHAGQIWPTGQLGVLLGMTEQNYGLEKNGDFRRIVSSGIAGWGYPVRTGGHSEYVAVTVKNPGKVENS